MKKVSRFVPEVSQRAADRGTEIVERHLATYGVSRAADLPEEGKVHLMRELRAYFDRELPEGMAMLSHSDIGWRGALKRSWQNLMRRGRARV